MFVGSHNNKGHKHSTRRELRREKKIIIIQPLDMLLQYYNGLYSDEPSINNQDKHQKQMKKGHPSPADTLRYSTDTDKATVETSVQNDEMRLPESSTSTRSSDPNISFAPTREQKPRPLSKSFVPGPRDVICARGKDARNHPGNVLLRSLVDQSVRAYENAQSRNEKTKIVSSILVHFGWSRSLNQFPNRSGGEEVGGFVKQDDVSGRWYAVDEASAREKVGQGLRERLHGKYKSSTKAKRQKNKLLTQKIKDKQQKQFVADSISNVMSLRMNELGEALKEIVGDGDTDDPSFDRSLEEAMTRTNSELINMLKQFSPWPN